MVVLSEPALMFSVKCNTVFVNKPKCSDSYVIGEKAVAT